MKNPLKRGGVYSRGAFNRSITVYQLKLSRKTQIYFKTLFARNNPIKSSIFPSCLEHADVTPLHKMCNKSLRESYRPVSILPILSEVSERSMFKEMSSFFDVIFSKYQYGFRNRFSTQRCLLDLLEKWKRSIERGKVFGALLTDLY